VSQRTPTRHRPVPGPIPLPTPLLEKSASPPASALPPSSVVDQLDAWNERHRFTTEQRRKLKAQLITSNRLTTGAHDSCKRQCHVVQWGPEMLRDHPVEWMQGVSGALKVGSASLLSIEEVAYVRLVQLEEDVQADPDQRLPDRGITHEVLLQAEPKLDGSGELWNRDPITSSVQPSLDLEEIRILIKQRRQGEHPTDPTPRPACVLTKSIATYLLRRTSLDPLSRAQATWSATGCWRRTCYPRPRGTTTTTISSQFRCVCMCVHPHAFCVYVCSVQD